MFYIFVTFPSLFCYSQVHREANQTLDTFVEKKFKEDFCCRKLLVAAVNRCVAIQADRYCHLARTKHQGGFMQNELEEGSLLIFIFLDARYLALFEILIGNHEVAQLLGGCDLVR